MIAGVVIAGVNPVAPLIAGSDIAFYVGLFSEAEWHYGIFAVWVKLYRIK